MASRGAQTPGPVPLQDWGKSSSLIRDGHSFLRALVVFPMLDRKGVLDRGIEELQQKPENREAAVDGAREAP